MSTENSPVICAVEEGVVTATILVSQIRDPLVVDSLRTSILQAIDASDARSVIIDFSNLKSWQYDVEWVVAEWSSAR
jgi:hypothetical protein